MSRNKKQTQAVNTAENTLPQDNVPSPPPEEKTTDETADKAENLTDDAKSENDETQNPAGNPPPADNADSTATGENEGSEKSDELSVAEKTEGKEPEDKSVIEPVAFEVKLKSIHPQATYGRCGYRFSKETAVEIAREALTDEQVITLASDPYLECVPVVEGDA